MALAGVSKARYMSEYMRRYRAEARPRISAGPS